MPNPAKQAVMARIGWAHANLAPVQPQYRIVYQDDIDAPAKVVSPTGEWLAQALHGGILPPIGDYGGRPLAPMCEEEAMVHLVRLVVPRHVWDGPASNRPRFLICRVDQVPSDRTFRNAWRLAA